MKVRLTRGFIIRAIRKEYKAKRLNSGRWISTPDFFHAQVVDMLKTDICEVCAVGAVMIHALHPRQTTRDVYDACCQSTYIGFNLSLRQQRSVYEDYHG